MTRSQSKNTGRIARLAVLTAMALALQWLETLLPPPVPAVPVRIGLANIFVLYAMMEMTPGDALAVSVLRSLLLPLITGNVSGLLYSLCGGVLSWIAMTVLLGSYRRGRISSIGLSVAGAAAFQIGQVLAGCFIVGTVIFRICAGHDSSVGPGGNRYGMDQRHSCFPGFRQNRETGIAVRGERPFIPFSTQS